MTELDIANLALDHLGEGEVTQTEYTTGTKTKALESVKRVLPNLKRTLLASHPWNCAVRRAILMPQFDVFDVEFTINGTTTTETVTYSPSYFEYVTTQRVWLGTTYRIDKDTDGTFHLRSLDGLTTYLTDSFHTNFATQSPVKIEDWTKVDPTYEMSGFDYTTLNDNCDPKHEYTYRQLRPIDYSITNLKPLRNIDIPSLYNREFRIEGDYILTNELQQECIYVEDIDYPDLNDMIAEVLSYHVASTVAWKIVQSESREQALNAKYEAKLRRAKTIDAQEDGRYVFETNAFHDARYGIGTDDFTNSSRYG